MRRLRASSIPTILLLACVGVALTGCADDPGDFPTESSDPSSEPPPEPAKECTFTYQNAIKDNATEVDIWLVYLFPAGSSDIGDDLLGSDILPYGYELNVNNVPEGRYDTMVVDEDAYYYIQRGVDCDGSDWAWLIDVTDVDGQLDVAGGGHDDIEEALAELDVSELGELEVRAP